jgi:1-acyl-sn-glycerol-3-phosphate acyltransferase
MSEGIVLPGKTTRWHYRQVVNWFGPALLRLLGGWHVSGQENVPPEGGVLICPNHISYADPPLIGVAARRRCCYMSKAEVFEVPLIGWFITISYVYPVDREGGGRQAIRIATTLLEAGEAVVLFPEGTRSPDGELLPGQLGAAYIASRAKVPIVPAAVWGTDVLLPLHSKRLYRCPVHVRFGEPFRVPESEGERHVRKELLQPATDELMSRIAELQRQLRAEVPEKWRAREARLKAR